jgi:Tripartite tricarboxylate transporter TctB family
MDQGVQPKAQAAAGEAAQPADGDVEPQGVVDEHVGDDELVDDDSDPARDKRITRLVHIVLGLVIAGLGAWLLYRSSTELAFRGPNGEPGPGYLPVLLTSCLIVMGLLLAGVWAFGAKARHGEAPTLSLHPRQMGRALLVWGALVVCGFLIEPLGFLLAGEVFVLLIMAIERIRSIPLIISLLLVPPAMYVLFDTLLEVQLPGGTLWY